MLLPELVIQSDNPYDDESSHGSADMPDLDSENFQRHGNEVLFEKKVVMEFVSSSDLDGESVALTTKCDLDEYSCR
jgi:hypothetical protein